MYHISEKWRPIRGYEGIYSISNSGRIRRERRVIVNRRGIRMVLNERILKPYYRRGKGFEVTLKRGHYIRTYLVHVLVREHFQDHDLKIQAN